MKKFFILSSFLGFAWTSAQMVIKKHDGTVINDGSVFEFSSFDDNASKLYFKVANASTSEDIRIKMICESLENSNGMDFQFCFGGYCMPFVMLNNEYPPEGYTLAPGADTGDSDFFWNQRDYNAPMKAKFKIYQVDDQDGTIGSPVNITYVYDKNLAVSDVAKSKDVVLKNTIVTNQLELNSKINTSYQLFDLNARLLKSASISKGDNSINLSDLDKGVFILTFKNENGKLQSQKIIKK